MKDADDYEKLWKSGAFELNKQSNPDQVSNQTPLNPNIHSGKSSQPKSKASNRITRGEFLTWFAAAAGLTAFGGTSYVLSKGDAINHFLIERTTFPTKPPPQDELIASEKNQWFETLGTQVEVKPLPSYLTPDVKKKLIEYGFELMYIPSLNLGTRDDLLKLRLPRYLDELERKYPRWRPYEKSWFFEKYLSKFSGNLNHNYWERFLTVNYTALPSLPGQWAAIENLPRPSLGTPYKVTPVSTRLGVTNRFGDFAIEGINRIDKEKAQLIKDMGIMPGPDLRLLQALEYNLVFNRKQWGSDSREWVSGGMVIGGSESPYGASQVSNAAFTGWSNVGFRIGVFFE